MRETDGVTSVRKYVSVHRAVIVAVSLDVGGLICEDGEKAHF